MLEGVVVFCRPGVEKHRLLCGIDSAGWLDVVVVLIRVIFAGYHLLRWWIIGVAVEGQ